MQGGATYNSLKEAVDDLTRYAQNLDDPIDQYLNETKQVGENGEAWGGTAAESIVNVLEKIKADIVVLQDACNEFSSNVSKSLQNYAAADAQNQAAVNDVISQ